MTFSSQEVIDELSALGYNDVPDVLLKNTMREIYGLRRWNLLHGVTSQTATVANQGVVQLSGLVQASERVKITAVRLAQGTSYWGSEDFREIDVESMENLRHTERDVGRPQFWARASNWAAPGSGFPLVTNDVLLLWPYPDTTYTLTISYNPSAAIPALNGDSLFWPQELVNVVVQRMLMKLTWQQKDWGAHDRAKATYKEALLDAIAQDHLLGPTSPDQVEEWSGWKYIT